MFERDEATWVGDRAMGVELEAVDVEAELEWAESQGRQADAGRLRLRLADVLEDLAHLSEPATAPVVRIHARRVGRAA